MPPPPDTRLESSHDAALHVDLDGTLFPGDTLWESLVLLAKKSPLSLFRVPGWLLRGRAQFKREVAKRVTPDAETLPYRPEVLEFVRERRAAGQRVVLTTAADEQVAQAVADHLGLFDAVMASDGVRNLKGQTKLAAIREGVARFDYAGDSPADLPLLQAATRAYLVSSDRRLLARLKAAREPERVFAATDAKRWPLLRAMRPHQWVKNLLIFVPLVLAHQVGDARRLLHVAIAFAAFCLSASAVYLLNDILDIDSDRKHPRKRDRPFARGELSIPFGLAASTLLAAGSLVLSLATLPASFTAALVIYLGLTTSYSLLFKRKLLLDVICLAGLYTQRIVAGSLAAEVVLTPWLLAFSMFLFLSLAFAKRYTELALVRGGDGKKLAGRAYLVEDLEVIESVGPTSGYLAVLVLALYINSDLVHSLYLRPAVLWLICPVMLYWITRVWFFARRGVLADDPVVFALRDRVSLVLGVLALALAVIAWL